MGVHEILEGVPPQRLLLDWKGPEWRACHRDPWVSTPSRVQFPTLVRPGMVPHTHWVLLHCFQGAVVDSRIASQSLLPSSILTVVTETTVVASKLPQPKVS